MEKPSHVLVVEDDDEINRLLCSILRKSGYVAQPAYSGTEALLHLERRPWDLVLLDLMLPGMTGEELLAKLSADEAGLGPPVIVISAKGERETRISTLRIGADDFITKPFDVEEVSARIDSRLRRANRAAPAAASEQLRHYDLCLDREAKLVTAGGAELTLTAREFAILELFLTYPKKVFTKANVFESVWGEEFMGDDNTVTVHMSNLRNKLAKANPDREYIETIWGMGYRLK